MSVPAACRARLRRRRGPRDDGGYVLPVVLGIAVLALLLVGATTTTAVHITGSARGERVASQARASAEAGVAEAIAEIARASVPNSNGVLLHGIYQCAYDVNEYNHTPRGSIFYNVNLRYGEQLPSNAPSSSACATTDPRRTALTPQPGTITLVARGTTVDGQRAFFGSAMDQRGYNTHSIDVVLTNVGTLEAPVWSVTTWRDRLDS